MGKSKRWSTAVLLVGFGILLASCASLIEEQDAESAGKVQLEAYPTRETDAEAAAERQTEPGEATSADAESPEHPAEESAEKPTAEYREHPTAPGTPESGFSEADLLAAVLENQAAHVAGTLEVLPFIHSLESDRLLLVEIRKQVPEDRMEVEIYLERLKYLSSRSDPVRLVPLVNRVLENSTTYFDWLETEFESPEEELTEYYIGGARSFHFALEEFQSAVMFTIINRLEIAGRLIRDLEAEMLRLQEEEEY